MKRYIATFNLAIVVTLISLGFGSGTAEATFYLLHSEYSFTDGSLLDTGPAGNDLVLLAPGAGVLPGTANGIPNPPGWGFDPQAGDAVKQNDCGVTGCTNGNNGIYSTAGGGLGLDPSMGVKYELSFEANPGLGVNGNLNNPAFSPSVLLRATGNGADDQIGLANKLFNGVPQAPAELSFSMFNPGLAITETVTIAQDPAGISWAQANSGYTRVRAGYDPMLNRLFLNVSTRNGTDGESEVFQSAVSAPLPVGWAAGLAAPDQLLIGGETADGSGNRVIGANLDEYQVFQGSAIPEPTSAALALLTLGGLGLWRRRRA